jgi:myo-inositol-1(or 4)-monophosphatase
VKAEEIERRHDACVSIAKESGALAQRYFDEVKKLSVESKGVQDYVSEADRAVEKLIRDRLLALFPDDRFFGEESGLGEGDGGALWVVDPIDGTHNFLRGYPHYGVSIAFMADGKVETGALYDPSMRLLASAMRGHGARLNGSPIRVSNESRLDHAIVCVGFSHSSSLQPFEERFARLVERRCEFRRIGSAALGLLHVAAGHFDAFWQMHLHAWDVLAGLLIVDEAGGRTNPFLVGRALEEGNVVLAAGPAIYPELEKLLEIAG